jgi:hypothetical protein
MRNSSLTSVSLCVLKSVRFHISEKARSGSVRVATRRRIARGNPCSRPKDDLKEASDIDVEELAYSLWESRGRPFGDDWTDWFAAEAQLRSRPSATTTTVTPALRFDLIGSDHAFARTGDHGWRG